MIEPPPILTFTDAAAARLRDLAAEDKKPLRLSLENAGCAGMAYRLDYAAEINPADAKVAAKGAELLVAAEALMFVLGTKIDYQIGEMQSGFVFNNPNQTDACGCGESVLLEEAETITQS